MTSRGRQYENDDCRPSPRDEIRASSYGALACPSCGKMSAEIVGTRHRLVLAQTGGGGMLMECRDGVTRLWPGDLDYDEMIAGANISLADQVTFNFDKAAGLLGPPFTGFTWLPEDGHHQFTGLLDIISDDGGHGYWEADDY